MTNDNEFESEKEILKAIRNLANNSRNYDLADSADILTQDIDDIERAIEAILFASSEPLTPNDIAEIIGDTQNIGNALAKLKRRYIGRGVNLVEVAGGWRFQTSEDLAPLFSKKREEPRKLSNAAMETLAIIAYHQPCTRAEIEEIRGVSVGRGTLDLLMEMKWIKYGSRRKTAGKPMTYKTTPEFLAHFNLANLDDLPGKRELEAQGLLSANLPKDFEIPRPSINLKEEQDDDVDNNESDEFVTDFFGEDE